MSRLLLSHPYLFPRSGPCRPAEPRAPPHTRKNKRSSRCWCCLTRSPRRRPRRRRAGQRTGRAHRTRAGRPTELAQEVERDVALHVQRQLAAIRHPELHEGTRPEGPRHHDLMPPGRAGLVQIETGSVHGLDAGTLQLDQNADVASGGRSSPLDGQEARVLHGGPRGGRPPPNRRCKTKPWWQRAAWRGRNRPYVHGGAEKYGGRSGTGIRRCSSAARFTPEAAISTGKHVAEVVAALSVVQTVESVVATRATVRAHRLGRGRQLGCYRHHARQPRAPLARPTRRVSVAHHRVTCTQWLTITATIASKTCGMQFHKPQRMAGGLPDGFFSGSRGSLIAGTARFDSKRVPCPHRNAVSCRQDTSRAPSGATGSGRRGSDDTDRLHTVVKKLRHKLGDNAAAPTYICTERGVSYRLATPGGV